MKQRKAGGEMGGWKEGGDGECDPSKWQLQVSSLGDHKKPCQLGLCMSSSSLSVIILSFPPSQPSSSQDPQLHAFHTLGASGDLRDLLSLCNIGIEGWRTLCCRLACVL